jgi:hypothetical protein
MDTAIVSSVQEAAAPVVVACMADAGAAVEDPLDEGVVDADERLGWDKFPFAARANDVRSRRRFRPFDADDVVEAR